MKKAPKEYDQIKKLVEEKTDLNIINNIDIKNANINPTKNIKIMSNRKINNKSKKIKNLIKIIYKLWIISLVKVSQ